VVDRIRADQLLVTTPVRLVEGVHALPRQRDRIRTHMSTSLAELRAWSRLSRVGCGRTLRDCRWWDADSRDGNGRIIRPDEGRVGGELRASARRRDRSANEPNSARSGLRIRVRERFTLLDRAHPHGGAILSHAEHQPFAECAGAGARHEANRRAHSKLTKAMEELRRGAGPAAGPLVPPMHPHRYGPRRHSAAPGDICILDF
jgi:hypothetical protein